MKTVYVCEYCGLEFTNFDECFEHENKGHIKPYYTKPVRYSPENPTYPEVVRIEMSDGVVVEYTYSRIFKEAEEVA